MGRIMYKSLWIAMFVVVLGMSTMLVSADELSCREDTIASMRSCLGTDEFDLDYFTRCIHYDLNGDGRINLIDVSLLARQCYSANNVEGISETIQEPIKNKSGSSVHISKEIDGSYTYRTHSRTIQHVKDNMIVKNKKGFTGTTYWGWKGMKYQGTFSEAYGYNYVNIMEVFN